MLQFEKNETAAVIAAHPDDEILGCGATVKKLADSGCSVSVLILGEGLTARESVREPGQNNSQIGALRDCCKKANRITGAGTVELLDFPDNRFDAVDFLDVVKAVERFLQNHPADIVFTHHRGDLNIDHQITNRAVLTACRPVSSWAPHTLMTFDVLSSTEWNFGARECRFVPNIFVDVTETIEEKVRALCCYESELLPFPFPRSLEAVRCQAQYYGQMVNTNAAEAFDVLRAVIGLR